MQPQQPQTPQPQAQPVPPPTPQVPHSAPQAQATPQIPVQPQSAPQVPPQAQTAPIQSQTQTASAQAKIQPPVQVQQAATHLSNATATISKVSKTLFPVMLDLMKKPITTIKAQMTRFDDTKSVLTLAIFVTSFATILGLLNTFILTTHSKPFKTLSTITKSSWNFKKFAPGHIPAILLFHFILYAGLIAAIAITYFLASSVLKKNITIIRCIGIASVSIVPFIICNVATPALFKQLLSMPEIYQIISSVGIIYSMLLLISATSAALGLEDNDTKIYTHLISLSVIAIAYTFLSNLTMNSLSKSAGLNTPQGIESLFNDLFTILPFL